jgi:phosphohistidine phosphatase SixA/CHAD domain-containing protein
MRHLYLMRHAKAKQGSGDMPDHRRPLRRRGRRQAAAMATPLQRLNALEGEIHVSSAKRTRQTLEQLEAQLPALSLAERARIDDALYTFDGKALLAWLRALPNEAERVLVIGHNPALLELARWLCREAPDSLPTAGLLHLTLPDEPWQALGPHCAGLAASLTPEKGSHALFQRRAPEPPDLAKAGPARRIRGLLAHQTRRVRALEPGVMAGADPEFLHQYRVNLRRSRAIGEAVLSIVTLPGLGKRLKRLKRRAQATSDLRDLDVFLESLAETPPPLSPGARQALQRWLSARRREQHQALCQQLSQPDYAEEMQAWQDAIASRGFRQALRQLSTTRIEAVLSERIARHDRDLAALSPEAADEAFHDLRKRVKRIRYLAELDPLRHRAFLAALKHRQTLLGSFQDLSTRQAWIEGFAASDGNAPGCKGECDAWCAALEKQKLALRGEVMALAPLAH